MNVDNVDLYSEPINIIHGDTMKKFLKELWLKSILAFLGVFILIPQVVFSEEIRVLNWKGYGTDEKWAVDIFSSETGIKVVHDYFNSEQEMMTKLRTTPGYYDVVLINSAFTKQVQSEGLISLINSNKIKNYSDLSPGMAKNPSLANNGNVYGVAWVWGVTSFAVDSTVFNNLPDTIEVLWDPKYKGKVSVRDDAVEIIQLTAIATGQDINNPSNLDIIREKLIKLKPQIRTYWSSEDQWNQFFSADEFDIATYWSGSASRSKTAFKLPVEFIIPKEGAIGWLDGLSIATDAPNRSGAHKFIDWMIDPKFYVKWDTDVGAPTSANAKANSMLPASAFNRAVLGNPVKVSKVQFMGPMPDGLREKMLEIWQEVKAM